VPDRPAAAPVTRAFSARSGTRRCWMSRCRTR